jgi:NAD(P)-dependent dehydrogenase (short-subunit alcohol dehydrogenase family)
MRLPNKIGIVTAAGSGMGRAGALRFAKEGASVAVVDLNADAANAVVKEITDGGGHAIALSGDLRDDGFARGIVRETTRAFGALDFVWNHVGHPGPAAIEGLDWKDFDTAMDLNVRTVLVTTEAALPELRARGGGALLYTASTSGLTGSQFSPIYNIAKFGIVGLVHGLSKRYAREKIRVNAVCPGPVDTPMLRVFVARPDSQLPPGETPESLVVKRGGQTPMGRPARPEEIANAALFLISDEASYITGVALPVDGGATA